MKKNMMAGSLQKAFGKMAMAELYYSKKEERGKNLDIKKEKEERFLCKRKEKRFKKQMRISNS